MYLHCKVNMIALQCHLSFESLVQISPINLPSHSVKLLLLEWESCSCSVCYFSICSKFLNTKLCLVSLLWNGRSSNLQHLLIRYLGISCNFCGECGYSPVLQESKMVVNGFKPLYVPLNLHPLVTAYTKVRVLLYTTSH